MTRNPGNETGATPHRGDRWGWCLLILLPFMGSALVLLMGRHGIAMDDDTGAYFRAARDLSITALPYHYPPLYPVFLRLAAWPFGDLRHAALAVNVLSMFVSVTLLLVALRRYTRLNLPSLTLVAATVMLSYPMLYNHAFAMSEALFFTFVYGSLLALTWYASSGRGLVPLVTAAVVAGLSFYVRYAGLSLIAGGGFLVVWVNRRVPRLLWRDAAVYAMVSGGLMGLLLLFNVLRGGAPTDYRLHVHAAPAFKSRELWTTLTEYFMPYSLSVRLGDAATAVALGVFGAVMLVMVVRCGPVLFCGIYGGYACFYAAFVVLSLLLSSRMIVLNHRMMAPAAIALLPAVTAGAVQSLSVRCPRGARVIATLILVWLSSLTLVRGVRFIRRVSAGGIDYGSEPWRRSALLDFVTRDRGKTKFYSNAPAAPFLMRDARELTWLPYKRSPHTGEPNPAFERQMNAMRDEVLRGEALVVLFRIKHPTDADYPEYLPNSNEIITGLGLCVLRDTWDGLIIGPCTVGETL